MSKTQVTYTLDFPVRDRQKPTVQRGQACEEADAIPRIARLVALAIRFDVLVRAGTIRDYADLARRGRVTRARITQIMKLLDLAPDLQEQILFLPPARGLNERNLRSIVRCIDWDQQRLLFKKITKIHDTADMAAATSKTIRPMEN